jgi:hypothetical protein
VTSSVQQATNAGVANVVEATTHNSSSIQSPSDIGTQSTGYTQPQGIPQTIQPSDSDQLI